MSYSRNKINAWLSNIDITDKTVLDVGAGPKEKWALHFTKGVPKSYQTSDCDKSFECNIEVDLNSPMPWPQKYDVVFCLEVLEHTWNPVQALTHLTEAANEVIYISVPFINPHHDKWDYFRITGEWFQLVLPKLGFKQVKILERTATVGKSLLQQFYSTEGLRISKIRPEFGQYTYPIGYCIEARH